MVAVGSIYTVFMIINWGSMWSTYRVTCLYMQQLHMDHATVYLFLWACTFTCVGVSCYSVCRCVFVAGLRHVSLFARTLTLRLGSRNLPDSPRTQSPTGGPRPEPRESTNTAYYIMFREKISCDPNPVF